MLDVTLINFGDAIAAQIRARHRELATRWLERLVALLPVDVVEIFPSDKLLDHIPHLILELAEYVRVPEEQAISANATVVAKAIELGQLRHEQRASVHQLLREYQLLETILAAFVQEETARLGLEPRPAEAMAVITRLHTAVGVLQQTTIDTFIGIYTETIASQTDRLESFSRLVSHELRQPLSALQAAVSLLKLRDGVGTEPPSGRVVTLIERNVSRLIELTHQLEGVSRLREADDNAQVQRADLSAVASDVARQLREMADARGVTMNIGPDLGFLDVDVARAELVLTNLVSNAIKYSDPAKPDRFVSVTRGQSTPQSTLIEVRDNGIGIDEAHQSRLFARFFRIAHDDAGPGSGGLGLGLSIVKECMDALGGSITIASEAGVGTTFTLHLPAASATADMIPPMEPSSGSTGDAGS